MGAGLEFVSFASKAVQPSPMVYLRQDSILAVHIWNAVPGAIVAMSGAYVRADRDPINPNEGISYFLEQMTPTSDRLQNGFQFPVPEGFLQCVKFGVSGANVRRGQLFVLCTLQLGPFDVGPSYHLLLEDYISSQWTPGWPEGRIVHRAEGAGCPQVILGTIPGVGAEILQTVPTNALWYLHAMEVDLVASATVATRTVRLTIDDGTNQFARAPAGEQQTASQTVRYSAGAYGFGGFATVFSALIPLPNRLPLQAGWRIGTSTSGLQVGDQYGQPKFMVEELSVP